jgi:hypothetical protein
LNGSFPIAALNSTSGVCKDNGFDLIRGAWYSYQGNGRIVKASVNGQITRQLHIHEGGCGNLTCVKPLQTWTENEDSGEDAENRGENREPAAWTSPRGTNLMALWPARTGITYSILVPGDLRTAGEFQLTISVSPLAT